MIANGITLAFLFMPPVDEFTKLKTFPTRLYAEMIRDVLEQNGIPSFVKSDDYGVFGGGSFGSQTSLPVSLWVPKSEFDRAWELSDQLLDSI